MILTKPAEPFDQGQMVGQLMGGGKGSGLVPLDTQHAPKPAPAPAPAEIGQRQSAANLAAMAGAAEQPTYDATPRRLAEARRHGDVAQSRDLRAAWRWRRPARLIASAPSMAGLLRVYVATALAQAARGEGVRAAAMLALDSGLRILAVPLAVAFATPIIVGLVQTGGLWVGPPRADFGRLAIGRRRQGEALAALVRGALAVAILLFVAAVTLAPLLPRVASLAARRRWSSSAPLRSGWVCG